MKSPLTAFNQREKQFKRNLSKTYGRDYNIQEPAPAKSPMPDQESRRRREAWEEQAERREMLESLRDLNLSNETEIPNSFLYQPESDCRHWMVKRGKDKLGPYDLGQVQKMRDYFK